jgi:hypothetical protein
MPEVSDLLYEWELSCARLMGVIYPPNLIEFDLETGTGTVGYTLPHGVPPLIPKNGRPVRAVILSYDYKDIQDALKH